MNAGDLWATIGRQLPDGTLAVAPGPWTEHSACRGWSHEQHLCPVCDGNRVVQRTRTVDGSVVVDHTECGRCRGSGLDGAWFDVPDGDQPFHAQVTAARKAVCRQCPVMVECLLYYGAQPVSDRPNGVAGGRVWGSRNPGGERLVAPTEHGSLTEYRRGCRCPECKSARGAAG